MPAIPPDTTLRSDDLLAQVQRRAQERAGLVRLALGIVLYGVIVLSALGLPPEAVAVERQVEAGKVFVLVFAVLGGAVYLLARRDLGTRVLPYVTVVSDAALILGNLAYNHVATGNMIFLFPVIWIVPIALAANAIYFRPGLQILATAIYFLGIPLIALGAGEVNEAARAKAILPLLTSLGWEPNAVRLSMLVAAGLVLILAAFQGRRMIERAVQETALRLNLVRYLPGELAPVLSDDSFAELRAGQRLPVAILFVDIRGSTAMAAAMDPTALARFVTAFRRRVARAAAQHGGVIDKFVGDGALVVFGVPSPDAGDAARALACGRTLAALIARWNTERDAEPPVEIGIGIHCGEVFCGVVGDEDRLEFTVLGDPVNVAARLEAATKELGGPILASGDVVASAGEDRTRWREVSREPLRGVGRSIAIMAPVVDDSGQAARTP